MDLIESVSAGQWWSKWLQRFFLPDKAQLMNRLERYQWIILMITLVFSIVSSLLLAILSWSMPMQWTGKLAILLMPLVPLSVYLYVRWTGQFRNAALAFALLVNPLVLMHNLSFQTVYIGYFYWIPWTILFVTLLSGFWQGLIVLVVSLLSVHISLDYNSIYGHHLGIFNDFAELYQQLVVNQVFSSLAVIFMMFTFALHNDRMEDELQSQKVLRAQNVHQTMIGEMLGNLAHEVNNPLAIISTAVVHYERLLETSRLSANMQAGLVDRMITALHRLSRVVRELSRSEDGSTFEFPAVRASSQSGQDIPESYPLRPDIEATVETEPPYPSQLQRMSEWGARILDAILPRATLSWPTSQRHRARATALVSLIGLISGLFNLVQMHMESSSPSLFIMGYLFVVIAVLEVFVMKLVPRPQLIGVGYIFAMNLAIVGMAFAYGHSVLLPVLHWIVLSIGGLFFIASPRTALIASIVLTFGFFLMMQKLREYGFVIGFGQTFSQYVSRMYSGMFLISCTIFFLASSFNFLMDKTYGRLVKEKDWQLRSAQLREINELANSAAILIGRPLRELGARLAELQVDGRNREILQRMHALVDQITAVSQSFALLSRPGLHEDIQTIDGGHWMEHIKNICLRRAAEADWHLETQVEPANGVIEGPLGRLTMLVITSLKEAFGHRAPQPGASLRLYAAIGHASTLLTIQYSASPTMDSVAHPQGGLDEALRISLLQELIESLGASVSRHQEKDEIILNVEWKPAFFRTTSYA